MNGIYLNGEFLPANHAKVSVFDRGFLFGDGVYEVVPVYHGRCFQLTAHLTRLQSSLNGIKINNPHTAKEWRQIVAKVIANNGGGDQSIYIQVTRGQAPRDHLFPQGIVPTVFVMSMPFIPVLKQHKTQGIAAITLDDTRWHHCNIKATSLLANCLIKEKANKANAMEALLVYNGYVTEGSASNVYIVIDSTIHTAPKGEKVLPGITRDVVFTLANKATIPITERAVSSIELKQAADEIWISSSTKEVLPVTLLDGKPVGNGKPGAIWQKMDALYQQYKLKR